jgi:hypothetical protein
MRAIERWGIPQDVAAEPSIDSRIPLNPKHELSLSLSQNVPFETHCFKLNPDIARISFFPFSRCTTLDYSNISFLFTNFYYLHQNLTVNILHCFIPPIVHVFGHRHMLLPL